MQFPIKKVVFIFGIAVVIVGIILFALSFGIVDINEYGLEYSSYTKELFTGYYSPGRYFVGIANKFFTFPSTPISIEYSDSSTAQSGVLRCFTSEGVSVNVSLTFSYLLRPERLRDNYLLYQKNLQAAVIRLMPSKIMDITIQYTASQFYSDRTTIENSIIDALNRAFADDFNDLAYMFYCQLMEISYSTSIESMITSVAMARQNVTTASAIQNSTLLNGDLLIQDTIYDGRIRYQNANATAYGNLQTLQAEAYALYSIFSNLSYAYGNLMTALGITSDIDKLHLIYAMELENIQANNFYLGLGDSNQVV